MNEHPKGELLAEIIYGEADPETRAHVEGCERCGARVERWRAASGALNCWQVAEEERPAVRGKWWGGVWRTAVAAVLVLGGIVLGRSGRETEQVDVEEVKREVITELLAALDERRGADLEVVTALLERQGVELAAIRHDLETVAWNAEQRIGSAEEGILRLASLSVAPGGRGEEEMEP